MAGTGGKFTLKMAGTAHVNITYLYWRLLLPYHTVYASSLLEFVKPASAGLKFTNISTRSRHFLCEIRMQQPCLFTNYRLQNNCCSLIHTNNTSTSSIVCDLCFVSTFTPFATSISLISFFVRMELIVDANFPFPYILRDRPCIRHFCTLLRVLSWILSGFLPSLSKGWHSELSLVPWWLILQSHSINNHKNKTMFWMNTQSDAHSMRNKGRLSHEHMGCFVWVLYSGKWADEFDTDHF